MVRWGIKTCFDWCRLGAAARVVSAFGRLSLWWDGGMTKGCLA